VFRRPDLPSRNILSPQGKKPLKNEMLPLPGIALEKRSNILS